MGVTTSFLSSGYAQAKTSLFFIEDPYALSQALQLASGNGSALRPSARQESVCKVLPSRQAFQALIALCRHTAENRNSG
jgi:hypothetical protein